MIPSTQRSYKVIPIIKLQHLQYVPWGWVLKIQVLPGAWHWRNCSSWTHYRMQSFLNFTSLMNFQFIRITFSYKYEGIQDNQPKVYKLMGRLVWWRYYPPFTFPYPLVCTYFSSFLVVHDELSLTIDSMMNALHDICSNNVSDNNAVKVLLKLHFYIYMSIIDYKSACSSYC